MCWGRVAPSPCVDLVLIIFWTSCYRYIPYSAMQCLCYALWFSSMLCPCPAFRCYAPARRPVPCPCIVKRFLSMRCPCFLCDSLLYHAFPMQCYASACFVMQCPSYSLPCNAIAVPGFSVQCLCFHTLCVAFPSQFNLFGTKPLQFHAILCLCFAKRSHRPV